MQLKENLKLVVPVAQEKVSDKTEGFKQTKYFPFKSTLNMV